MIEIGIVDDHQITRAGLREYFHNFVDMRVQGDGATLDDALRLAAQKVDVLVLDLQLGRSETAPVRRILEVTPGMKIVVFSGMPEEVYAPAVMQLGAMAFVSKDSTADVLAAAVRNAARGTMTISGATRQSLASSKPGQEPHSSLSGRELAVFLALAKGHRLVKTAEDMKISIKTASTYRARVLQKMNMESNQDMTRYALVHGLIV